MSSVDQTLPKRAVDLLVFQEQNKTQKNKTHQNKAQFPPQSVSSIRKLP